MNLDDFAESLKESAKAIGDVPPCTSLWVDFDGDCVELLMDTKANTFSEWIPGEGGDIGLIRDIVTARVVGIRLPLIHKPLKIGFSDGRTAEFD